ncbi:MAG: hypothetical protein WB239_08250 [Acidimicrobiia bacterium]
MARRDVLGEEVDDFTTVTNGSKARALLAGQKPDGGFGVHPYRKWAGAHWRLVSLVDLGIPGEHPGMAPAVATVLDWLTSERHRSRIRVIDGLTRRCASQEGNALAVASQLGLASDPRVQLLAESLVGWQWPDGGWNCSVRASGRRSSFHETLPPIRGLFEYWRATGEDQALQAARRAAELLLEHRLFRALKSGEPIHKSWVTLHYPPYWHYDVLGALNVLGRMQLTTDPRCSDGLEILAQRRLEDGRWRPGGYWWNPPGSDRPNTDVVDWGRSAPNEMITLTALRVYAASGLL